MDYDYECIFNIRNMLVKTNKYNATIGWIEHFNFNPHRLHLMITMQRLKGLDMWMFSLKEQFVITMQQLQE